MEHQNLSLHPKLKRADRARPKFDGAIVIDSWSLSSVPLPDAAAEVEESLLLLLLLCQQKRRSTVTWPRSSVRQWSLLSLMDYCQSVGCLIKSSRCWSACIELQPENRRLPKCTSPSVVDHRGAALCTARLCLYHC